MDYSFFRYLGFVMILFYMKKKENHEIYNLCKEFCLCLPLRFQMNNPFLLYKR